MPQGPLGQLQVCLDLDNPPVRNAENIWGDERIRRMMTWKGALLLTGLISLVAVFNVTVFFVLRSAFWASSSEATQILKNPVISKTCGGIINISGDQKGYIVDEFGSFERCAWIIKSEMKKIRVQYANHSLDILSGTAIGELDTGDELFSCSRLESNGESSVMTPFVLYYTKSSFPYFVSGRRKFVIELTPVDDQGSHESQPFTYHVNKLSKGSLPLAVTAVRSESLLGMIAVFQTQKPKGPGRDFVFSPTGSHECCAYVAAYTMDLFGHGASCKKMSACSESDNGKQSSDYTVVMLQWSEMVASGSQCRLTWSEGPVPAERYLSRYQLYDGRR